MFLKEGFFGKNFNNLYFFRLFYLFFNFVFQISNFIEVMDKVD